MKQGTAANDVVYFLIEEKFKLRGIVPNYVHCFYFSIK